MITNIKPVTYNHAPGLILVYTDTVTFILRFQAERSGLISN